MEEEIIKLKHIKVLAIGVATKNNRYFSKDEVSKSIYSSELHDRIIKGLLKVVNIRLSLFDNGGLYSAIKNNDYCGVVDGLYVEDDGLYADLTLFSSKIPQKNIDDLSFSVLFRATTSFDFIEVQDNLCEVVRDMELLAISVL